MFATIFKSFSGSIALTLTVLAFMGITYGIGAMYLVALLGILEVALSFDNAVVNAKVLEPMESKWQNRFLLWGVPIAVFGMRFAFPLIVVAATTDLGLFQVYDVALHDPEAYRRALESGISQIYAFGGSFLLMVGLSWFFDAEREVKWIQAFEDNAVSRALAQVASVEVLISVLLLIGLMVFAPGLHVALPYLLGVALYMGLNSLDGVLSTDGVRNGLMGLLYLEVLDASFSFDGVLGAFALSNNILMIAAGLGIGAMFVRSLTLHFVRNKTLANYIFLEHGAHYAILTLALLMFAKMFIPVSDILTGTVGALFITAAWATSVVANRKTVYV